MPDWDLPRDPLAALRDGDAGPFEEFVRSHAPLLYHFFRRLGSGRHRAEDLTQELFMKLHQNSSRYQARERVASYVFRVARNVWIDDRRRRGVRDGGVSLQSLGEAVEIEEAGPGPLAAPDPAHRAVVSEDADRLRAAVETLGDGHRAVFELGAVEGLSYPEVASILEIPVGTVKSRMFYAFRKLREALGEPEPEQRESIPDGRAGA